MATQVRARIVRIVLSVGLLALVVALADWREVWSVLRSVRLEWAAYALALAIADRLILNVRWRTLLAARGVMTGFVRLFRVQLAANFLGSFLPSSLGVDAVRIGALCRVGHPPAQVIAATLIDRISIALATLVLGSITVLALARARIPPQIAQFVWLMTAVALITFGACLHPSVRRWVRTKLLTRIPGRLRQMTADVAKAALAFRHDGRTAAWVAITTAAVFLVRILFAKCVAYSCGADLAFLDLLLVVPILWIIVMLPITIGGLGVQDAGYVVLMSLLGVSAPVAVSMSLVEHIVVRIATLPGALFIGDAIATSPSARSSV